MRAFLLSWVCGYVSIWGLFTSLAQEAAPLWNTAVNVNAWLVNCLQQAQRGRRRQGKMETRLEEDRRVKGMNDDKVTALQRQHSTWPKITLQGKKSQAHQKESNNSYSNRLSVLWLFWQGALVSSILHARACLKLLLLLSEWAAKLCCPCPSGLPVLPTYIHAALVMQIHQPPWLSLSPSQALVLRIRIQSET